MRLYRLGAEGPAVRDIQDRLAALGHEPGGDSRGRFGEGTRAAVVAFQRVKGLDPDGIVGPDTWRSLYEAGYRLGDRILVMRRPMIRGEDVSEFQSRLSSLGFDAGKVDGVFGPDTERAVLEFQANRGLAEDGKAGPEVITEVRLVTRGEMREGRQAIREREWMRLLPPTIAGARVYLDASCRDPDETRQTWEAAASAALAIQEAGGLPVMSRSHDTQLPERARARRANRVGSDIIVGFRVSRDETDGVFYFASDHSSSAAGERLAEAITAKAGGVVEGRAGAMLKETRAPSAVVSKPRLNERTGSAVTDGLVLFFESAASPSPQTRFPNALDSPMP